MGITNGTEKQYDVLIIGGGIAGLAAALTLARQQHTAVVFDNSVYRNAPSPHVHNVLTWDHSSPADFRDAAKKNILDYYQTVEFESDEIVALEKIRDGTSLFKAKDAHGRIWKGRKVILAQGVRDIFPDIEGYEACWAKAIYHCFFCKGYEARGVPHAGILALPDLHAAPAVLHAARTAARFTNKITIYTHGNTELSEATAKMQGSSPIFAIDNRKIVKFTKGPEFADIVIDFENGEQVVEGFMGHKPVTEPKSKHLIEQLGCELTPMNDPKASAMFYETSVKDVFVGGDDASPIKIIPQALFSGSAAAAACCARLQAEDAGQTPIF